MSNRPRRRRGHALWLTLMDVVRSGRSGSWLLVVLIALTVLAALIASVGHLLPWLIYPAL